MKHSTRMTRTIVLGLVLAAATATVRSQSFTMSRKAADRAEQVKNEKQPGADLGNGYYRNPILPGGFADPSVVKVGKDYYLAFSRGGGMMIWHSRDLVNWAPVLRQTFEGLGSIWAVDLHYYDGKFHLYMPVGEWPGKTVEKYHANFVTMAEKAEGPWSKPSRVDNEYIRDEYYTGIDPGFIQTPQGKKYLYTDHGFVMPLSDDGRQATGPPQIVYSGWEYPKEWIVEGNCLESPKLFLKDGFYYLVSALGGTSGPSTAHMAVVARSQSPTGPWLNSPYNPLVHTYSAAESWWQQGHATIVEGPDGAWWTVYHARLNGYPALGRQTLLMPVEWTPDGWPVIKNGSKSWDIIPMPRGENVGNGMPISDDFTSPAPGMQWILGQKDRERYQWGNGRLVVDAQGQNSADATAASVLATNRSYEATVEIDCPEGVVAGLIFANQEGLKTDGRMVSYNRGEIWRTRNTDVPLKNAGHVFLRIRNFHGDLSFYSSDDGERWTTFQNGVRAENYEVRLFAAGKGKATFRHFRYLGLE